MINVQEHNTVLVGHERYFLFRSEARLQMVHDHCPHRGGPLSLARRTADDRRLSCPWHGTKVGIAALCRTALPMVRSGDEATVILPDAARESPVSVIHRRILANLPAAADPSESAATHQP